MGFIYCSENSRSFSPYFAPSDRLNTDKLDLSTSTMTIIDATTLSQTVIYGAYSTGSLIDIPYPPTDTIPPLECIIDYSPVGYVSYDYLIEGVTEN